MAQAAASVRQSGAADFSSGGRAVAGASSIPRPGPRSPIGGSAALGPDGIPRGVNPILVQRWRDPTWWDHVLAWWEGYDADELRRIARRLNEEARRAAAAAAAPAVAARNARPDPTEKARALETSELDRESRPVWTLERVQSAELLWGPDATGPSDPAWMVDAVRQFGLGPARSALDLTAGLGGAARAIAGAYDTWVTGLEPSPVLAELAMQRSKASGFGKKAPVTGYDPEHFSQAGSFDLVYGDRLLHKLRDKAFFLDKMSECVKDKGGLLMFDYVVDGTPQNWDAWNRWRGMEPTEVSPWSAGRFSEELLQRNFDMRVSENVTDMHRRQILSRVERLSTALNTIDPDSGLLGVIARELALWWARLKVLGRGLNFYRFVAFRA